MRTLKGRLLVFLHICSCNPTHKLCGERMREAIEDIDKLETIIREMVFINYDHEVVANYREDVDLSGKVSFPERLREVLE